MATTPEPAALRAEDVEHLRLLSIFHYVMAGLAALFACFPVIHLSVGLFMVLAPEKMAGGGGHPAFAGWLFIAIATFLMAIGWTLAGCLFTAARALERRRRYLFCLVVAAVTAALCVPLGTVLGVFTIVVLMRPPVKAAFGRPA